ncbi:MAG: zinc ABC transporter substrate-binding protein [Arcobacter sp.]|nr:zinc ABC transporter substrate-binding protein [Arcobacter sp.]
MFKKLLISAIIGASSLMASNVNAVVSILPEQTILQEIGGDKVNVSLMVAPGSSPHTYEPKPSQMKDINNAALYFAVGVEFEDAWLPKFKNQNQNMKIIDLSKGITKIAMEQHSHGANEHHSDGHKHGKFDPHIWTSISNLKIMSKTIFDTLVINDASNSSYYKANYEKFLTKLNDTDKQIKEILKNTKVGTKFMVFHPAWGYFAKDYGLVQFAIEVEGKNPTPKQIVFLINEAKEEKVKAIFTAPEFSEKVAIQIGKEVGIPVVKVSSLSPKVCENLVDLAKTVAKR